MKNEEFRQRALDIYKQAGRVPDIAAGMLEQMYGADNPDYRNIRVECITRAWEGLEILALREYVREKVRKYARRCKKDPRRIARKIRGNVRPYVLGYSLGNERVSQIMKDIGINPAKKPKYNAKGKPRGGNAQYTKGQGRKLKGAERERYRFAAVHPDAIGGCR